MVVFSWSEADLPVEEVIARREVRAQAALLVKHLDEMVRFCGLGMGVVVQNTLVDGIGGLRKANELTDLFVVWEEEVVRQSFHLVHLRKDRHEVDRLPQRHRRAADDQYLLEPVTFHSVVEIVPGELG